MRLYSLQGANSVQHEDHGSFDVDPETGAVEVPHELGERLHATHLNGAKAWETEAERHARLVAEEMERRRDPASMFELMQQAFGKPAAGGDDAAAKLAAAEAEIEQLRAQLAAKAPAKKAPAKKAAAPAAE